jgi:tetratricopeptide (TPR) repeat protein
MIYNFFGYGLPPFLIGTVAIVALQTQAAVALSVPEIGQIAKAVTVIIDDGHNHGSGVIIKRDGNTYTVLTAAHVVKVSGAYTVKTLDKQTFTVSASTIKPFKGVDLAILNFTSRQNYSVAEMGNSAEILEGSSCYIAGYPLKTKAITETIYNFTEGKVRANANKPLSDGYALVYSNDTLPGMSGGPVLDENGRLIGIHGRADTSEQVKISEINPNILVKTGFNLGIPINTFLSLANKFEPSLGFSAAISAVITDKSTASDFYLLAEDKYNKGDFQGAINNYDRVITINPNYAVAYSNRGIAYYQLKDYQKALVNLEKSISIDSRDAQSYSRRGMIYFQLKDYQRALIDLEKSISIDPKYVPAYNNRGVIHRFLNDYDKAITDYDKAIFINPQDTIAYLNRGLVYSDLKNYQRAIIDFEKVISISPEYALAYSSRGLIYAKLDNYQNAITDYNKAININPNDADLYNIRGSIYGALKSYQNAISDYDKAININPNDSNTYILRGLAYTELKNYKNAIMDYKKSIAINPHQDTNVFNYLQSAIQLLQKSY